MLPSSAYSSRRCALAATVVISLCFDRMNSVPMFCSRKQPVPYVFLASPALQHNCPKSAACWSPAMPAIATPPRPSVVVTSPTRSLDHFTSGSMLAGIAEELQQVRVPLALHDVEEQRARRVGHVGHVLLAAGQVPDQPAIHGAKGKLAALGPRPRALHVVENPLDLGRGEIWIDHETGLRRDRFSGTTLLQMLTQTPPCAGPATRSRDESPCPLRAPTQSPSRADW